MFDDWMASLHLNHRKMLAVIWTFKNRMQLYEKDAAMEAGSVVGFNEKTLQKTGMILFASEGQFTIHQYDGYCVYHDKGLNHSAARWVREHALVTGKPNMTAQSFCD